MTKSETLAAAARGEGCLGRSQDDEPVFVLVARDPYAALTVRHWTLLNDAGSMPGSPDRDKSHAARAVAREMEAWRLRRRKEHAVVEKPAGVHGWMMRTDDGCLHYVPNGQAQGALLDDEVFVVPYADGWRVLQVLAKKAEPR